MPQDDPVARGMMTEAELARRVKAANPRLATMPDDQVVKNYLSINPGDRRYIIGATTPMTGTAKIGGPPSDIAPPGGGRSPALREAGWNVANWMSELPSSITSAIGAAMMAPTGTPGMVSGAAAGSVPGSLLELGAKRLLFPPSKGWDPLTAESAARTIMKNMALNTGFEFGGRALRYLPGGPRSLRLAAEGLNLPENRAVAETSKEFGLGLTYPQISPTPRNVVRYSMFPRSMAEPRQMMEAGDEAILGRARQAVGGLPETAFGRQAATMSPDIAGKMVKQDIEDIGIPLSKEQTSRLVNAWQVAGQHITANPTAVAQMKRELRQEILERQAQAQRLSAVAKDPNTMLDFSARTHEIYDNILRLPDSPSVVDLNVFRSQLMKETPVVTEHFADEPVGQAKYFTQKLTRIIDDAVQGTPADRAWKTYRSFYDRTLETFKSPEVKAILKGQEPEKLAQSVGPRDISKAERIRRAVAGYAQMLGTPQQKVQAATAWNRFRAQWINEHVLVGDIGGLTSRLNAIDPKVMRIMIEHDPEGRTLVRNARRLGEAVDRVIQLQGKGGETSTRYMLYRLGYHAGTAALGGAAAALLGHSALTTGLGATAGVFLGEGAARAYGRVLARVLYSPQLTERAIQFTTWLARNPAITTANAMRLIDRFVEAPSVPGRTRPEEQEAGPPQPLRGLPLPKPSAGLDRRGQPMQPPPRVEENLQWPPPQSQEQPQ